MNSICKRIAITLLTILSACASNPHERCSDPSIASRYRDYDQCYSAETSRQAARHAAWQQAWAPLAQGQSSRSISCQNIGNTQYCREN